MRVAVTSIDESLFGFCRIGAFYAKDIVLDKILVPCNKQFSRKIRHSIQLCAFLVCILYHRKKKNIEGYTRVSFYFLLYQSVEGATGASNVTDLSTNQDKEIFVPFGRSKYSIFEHHPDVIWHMTYRGRITTCESVLEISEQTGRHSCSLQHSVVFVIDLWRVIEIHFLLIAKVNF